MQDPAARAAALAERLRSGQEDRLRFEYAAYVGDAGALEALGLPVCTCAPSRKEDAHGRTCPLKGQSRAETRGHVLEIPSGLKAWLGGVQAMGRGALVRAVVAVFHALLETDDDAVTEAHVRLVEAVEQWLADPSELNRTTIPPAPLAGQHSGDMRLQLPSAHLRRLAAVEPLARSIEVELAFTAILLLAERRFGKRATLPRGQARQTVAGELGPWLLLERDPVAERVAAREPLPELSSSVIPGLHLERLRRGLPPEALDEVLDGLEDFAERYDARHGEPPPQRVLYVVVSLLLLEGPENLEPILQLGLGEPRDLLYALHQVQTR